MKMQLKKRELKNLTSLVRKGHEKVRLVTRARVLLLAHEQETDVSIARVLSIGRSTVWRTKKNYVDNGLEFALIEKPRPGQPIKYDGRQQAEIIALACTTPPSGRNRWSVRLLAEELQKKDDFKTINRESIRLILKKATQNHG